MRHRASTGWSIYVSVALGLALAVSIALLFLGSTHERARLEGGVYEGLPAVRIGAAFPLRATATDTPAPVIDLKFNGSRALTHVKKLTSFGPRVSGSIEEGSAADYIELTLTEFGYSVRRQAFRAPNGQIANNVIAIKPGTPRSSTETPPWAALGAHYDTISGTVGANDNASGVAVVLETARIMHQTALPYDLRFILFGSEESENPSRDSYAGSLKYVDDLNDEFELNLPEDEDYDTVGGFVFSHLGYIPKTGETFDYENLEFTITAAETRRINRIRIHKKI